MKLSFGERLQGYRSARIRRPLDWLKQPFLDGQRALHRRLAALLPARMPRSPPRDMRSILPVRRNRLGDAIIVLPVLAALKEAYPGLRIGICASPYNAAVFARSALVDDLYAVPNKWLGNRWLVRWHPAVRAMHGVHYDGHQCIRFVFIASGAAGSLVPELKGR